MLPRSKKYAFLKLGFEFWKPSSQGHWVLLTSSVVYSQEWYNIRNHLEMESGGLSPF